MPYSMDEYFVLQKKPTDFAVSGQIVTVDSEKLAKALLCLSERRREIIFMRYYLKLRDRQIAALLEKPRTTVNYQKNAALKQLRKEMEKIRMKNSKYNLVSYEVIKRAITGGTAALLAVQERHKAYIGRLSGGNADMKERLNTKLLMAVLKFRLDYQPTTDERTESRLPCADKKVSLLQGRGRENCAKSAGT